VTKARTTTPTEVPGIPKPPAEVSPGLRRYLENLSEAVEIRLGRRGDARDRAITLRELIDSGLAVELANNPARIGVPDPPPPPPPPSGTTPTAPTSFTATGGYSLISVFWAYPSYAGHALTEIWRGTTNVLGDAQLVGVSSGISFVDPVGQSKTFFYWARHVNVYGTIGPYNSANGTSATTAADVVTLLNVLNGAITETQLFSALNTRINLIDGAVGVAGSVNARIASETSARTTADSALATSITTLTSTVNANTAAIQTEATTRATADNSLYAQYTVKIDLNGYISGFGLASTLSNATPFSEFLVRADRFSIGSPGRTSVTPFIVVTTPTTLNGVAVPAGVYMDAAFIRNGDITNARIGDAAIDNAKIANLSADKINAGSLDAARVSIDGVTLDTVFNSGLGRNVLRIRDLSITNNLIAANAAIDGAKIGSLSVNKLTGDITKFVTGYAAPSGNLPTSVTTVLTMQLPASTHPEGHRPYVQLNVQDQAYGVTLVDVELWSAPVGTGQSTPSLSMGAPASQVEWYEYDWETSTQFQVGWQLNYSGQLDVQVGDTITANTSDAGDVASSIYNGSQTIILVASGTASLGSTYTRTRPTLGNGVVGTYNLLASTFYDANDMIGVTMFAPEAPTLLGRSYQVRLKAQIANRVAIKRVDILAMGIR